MSSRTDTLRLLILDDNEMTAQTLQRIAEREGFDVRFATAPQQFFQWLDEWDPDHIALDLVMPEMDGVQVLAELAQRHCRACIIITSGVGGRVLEAAGRSAEEHGLHMTGVLQKPFTPAEFRNLLFGSDTHIAPVSATPQQAKPAVSASELAIGLQRRELFVVYQPKVDCRTGSLVGFEALARWRHPRAGLVPPDRFIPLAENHDLIDELTEYVMAESLEWFARTRQRIQSSNTGCAPQSIRLSVNISARSLENVELFERIERCCNHHGLTPEHLVLELTETSAMHDPVASLDILTRLRMKGFHLSIDDFGTGYSSMVQLVRLPFSEIKLDKSFVMTARKSQESRTVIKSIVDLGKNLGLKCTAEGIEDDDTLSYLRDVGCDAAQGYLIARPLVADQATQWALECMRQSESRRLQDVRNLQLLDTPPEQRFDRLTKLGQRIFNVPIVLVVLLDEHRQWFKSNPGLAVRETPRYMAFCTHTVDYRDILLVPDARKDPRFQNNPLVTGEPHIRFYAGCPLRVPNGNAVGTLCLIDRKPGMLQPDDLDLLRDMAHLVEKELLADLQAITDPLTSLLNRRGFESRATDALTLSVRLRQTAVLLFIDLEQFKSINDNHGHAMGDDALRKFADMLCQVFRESDLIARFGGDEFVLLMSSADRPQAIEATARLRQAIANFNQQSRFPFSLNYSIGWAALDPDNPQDLQALLMEADTNMYSNKSQSQGSAT
jgi:diguanylate cyclase (GGDEF)-like protein